MIPFLGVNEVGSYTKGVIINGMYGAKTAPVSRN
jgi:hypothetical protein